ncbi:hypothetical protein ACHIPZ_23590 [Antrihabitans sp. NCIMB 15449]
MVEVADSLDRLLTNAAKAGSLNVHGEGFDNGLVDLLDAAIAESDPSVERLMALLNERGWKGWTRIERLPADKSST